MNASSDKVAQYVTEFGLDYAYAIPAGLVNNFLAAGLVVKERRTGLGWVRVTENLAPLPETSSD